MGIKNDVKKENSMQEKIQQKNRKKYIENEFFFCKMLFIPFITYTMIIGT